jgi:hypothetical protein
METAGTVFYFLLIATFKLLPLSVSQKIQMLWDSYKLNLPLPISDLDLVKEDIAVILWKVSHEVASHQRHSSTKIPKRKMLVAPH